MTLQFPPSKGPAPPPPIVDPKNPPLPPLVAPPLSPAPTGQGGIPFFSGGGGSPLDPGNLVWIGGRLVNIVIPPGGFAGFAQQTPATQALFARAGRRGGRMTQRRRRRKLRARKNSGTRRVKSRRTARRASARKPARLVKGSAAAKRYMAKIRRKRR